MTKAKFNAQNAIIAAIQTRIDNAPNANQADTLTAERRFFEGTNATIILDKASALVDLKTLCAAIAVTDKRDGNFVAVYALQKVRKMLHALALNQKSAIDGYSNSIISNMVRLQEITNKSALVALSKSIEYSELERVQEIKRTINVAVSTASTQASSTRQMLRLLNIASVTKNRNADEFRFNDAPVAHAVVALYAK